MFCFFWEPTPPLQLTTSPTVLIEFISQEVRILGGEKIECVWSEIETMASFIQSIPIPQETMFY